MGINDLLQIYVLRRLTTINDELHYLPNNQTSNIERYTCLFETGYFI